MSFVNAIIRLNPNQIDNFLDNWRFDEITGQRLGNDFAPYKTDSSRETHAIDVYDPGFCMPDFGSRDKWKKLLVGPASQHRELLTIACKDLVELDWTDPQDPNPGPAITVLHYLREVFPGQLQIVDVFKSDGIRHGQTYIAPQFDQDGNPLSPEQIIGQPTYPPLDKATMVLHMPDDVTYDNDGNEISRTPATDYKEVHTILGFSPRRYE